MKQTTNYGFNKPELQDSPPDITVLNPNFDEIDGQLKSLTDKDTELNSAITKVKEDYLPKTGGNVTNGLTVKNKTVAVSVNGSTADANGNITIDVGGDVQSVNGVQPDEHGNVELDLGGDVQSVDGIQPDENGNVQLDALKQVEVLEAVKRVTDVEVDPSVAEVENLQISVVRAESNIEGLQTNIKSLQTNIESLQANKLDGTTNHIIETWKSSDGTQWYRKYSDGWVEQGGRQLGSSSTTVTNLPVAMKDTTYTALGTYVGGTDTHNYYSFEVSNKRTTTSIVFYRDSNTTINWYVCGYYA